MHGESVPNDTCCTGANWRFLDFTNEVCKVTPFLDSYEPVKEVMVARCGTVWTSPNTGHEYLLVGDQMLLFGNQMDHSLINPNQICEYGIPMYDNPFSQSQFGIDFAMMTSFPSIPRGLLCILSLVCRRIGKCATCQLLCLQVKTGTR
jgi:hypothetical protein